MGLLDALAKAPLGDSRVPASMLFYGQESFHVEHHPRKRVNEWKSSLETRRFGVVALGYARPGELESELVKRIDQVAGRAVIKALTSDNQVDIRLGDVLIECEAHGSFESVSKQRSFIEAADELAHKLDLADDATAPWEKFVLWISADVVTTWNYDRLLESTLEGQEVSEATMPRGMAPELLNRYEKARESTVKEFGLLRSEDLARAIHSTAENVSLVASKWRRKGEVFAVNYGGKPGYLAFQFDPVTGRPKPVIARIIKAFPPNTDGWRLALWLASVNPRLANRRPIDVIDDDPERVIAAAKGENGVELF